jgi:mannan polymerase II complex MNN10 subunit
MQQNSNKPRIAILSLAIGADYRKAMHPGLESKQKYAEKHGYSLFTDGNDIWDRRRPIPWSKFNFILKYLNDFDYIFWSDADAIILNQDLTIEDHILPLLPPDKDLLWSYDACNHYNNGNMLIRGRSNWAADFFKRAYQQTDLLYHIWWDNAAMIKLFSDNESDKLKIQTCEQHWLFNAYVFGVDGTAKTPNTRFYKHGDFLIHFAGVYDWWNINRMMIYVKECADIGITPNPDVLTEWRQHPPN